MKEINAFYKAKNSLSNESKTNALKNGQILQKQQTKMAILLFFN
jgi:hypothetical protein